MNRLHLGAIFALFLALQFVPGVGVRDAQAGCSGNQCDTKQEAYPWGAQQADAYVCSGSIVGPPKTYSQAVNPTRYWELNTRVYCTNKTTGVVAQAIVYTTQFPTANGGCPVGTTWDEPTKTCYSSAACLAKPPLSQAGTFNLSVSSDRCDAGCKFSYRGQSEQMTIADGTPIKIGFGGTFKPTGAACASGDPVADASDKAPPDQSCAPAPDGQTFCVKKDGRQCYSATTGRQICWRPGETGEKTDGEVLQVRVAGGTAGPATMQAPYGAMFEPAASGVKIMAEYGWFRDEGPASDVTVTTTTQNHTASNGVNAGGSSPDAGENSDGTSGTSTGGAGDSGTGTGAGGSASGGEACATPPVCSGDPVGCAVLAQQFAARCEAATGRDVTGADLTLGDGPADSTGLWSAGEGGDLDMTGFLTGRTCPLAPTFTIYGMTRTIDTEGMCDLGEIIAALVLLMTAAHCAWIFGEA